MITEHALLATLDVGLELIVYGSGLYGSGLYGDGEVVDLTPHLTRVSIRRGGTRAGLGIKTDVGLMTLTIKDAQDPLSGGILSPGQMITARTPAGDIFTGKISPIQAAYPLDKQTGRTMAITTVTVADAVSEHTKTQRYGVTTDDGYETFEARIARLELTARSPVEAPASGAPVEVYAL